MKMTLLLSGCALLIIGIWLGMVSAPRYGLLLAGSLVLELGAIACLAGCVRPASTLGRALLILGIVIASTTIVDALLRLSLGLRVFDVFR
jgi:hypothetical protein